jgi:hypothetical protein
MNSLYFPFGSLQEIYTLLYLTSKFDKNIEIDTLQSVFNEALHTTHNLQTVKLGN